MAIFVAERGRESLLNIKEFSGYEEGALDNMAKRTFHLSVTFARMERWGNMRKDVLSSVFT